jgi:hypothetical protein
MLSPASAAAPMLLIMSGSRPTDRDGNNPLGVKAATYSWWRGPRNRSRVGASALSVPYTPKADAAFKAEKWSNGCSA